MTSIYSVASIELEVIPTLCASTETFMLNIYKMFIIARLIIPGYGKLSSFICGDKTTKINYSVAILCLIESKKFSSCKSFSRTVWRIELYLDLILYIMYNRRVRIYSTKVFGDRASRFESFFSFCLERISWHCQPWYYYLLVE